MGFENIPLRVIGQNISAKYAGFGAPSGVITPVAQGFITVWETTSDSQTLTIPHDGTGYDGAINWYNNSTDALIVSDTFSDADMSGLAQVMPTTGEYRCEITGDFPKINTYQAADDEFLIEILNAGDVNWASSGLRFTNAGNLVSVEYGDFIDVFTTIRTLHQNNNNLATAPDMTGFALVIDASLAFHYCGDMTTCPDLSGCIVNKKLYSTFRSCSSLTTIIPPSIRSVTTAEAMLTSTPISTASYDAMWVAFRAEAETYGAQDDTDFGGGAATCTIGGAGEAARQWFVDTYSWVIVDGGSI